MKLRQFALAATLIMSGTLLTVEASAGTLIIDGTGELTGATGIDVGGTLYDVAFLDGTCVSVFDGCDSNSDFAFTSLLQTNLAAQTLLDQVFIGDFDNQPALTRGCQGTADCWAWIPYSTNGGSIGFTVDASGPVNGASSDNLFIGNTDPTVDFTAASALADFTWARFTPSAPAVPEPATWATMLLGFGGIGFVMRRKRTQIPMQMA